MRARELVYHLTCFTCVACGTLLSKGDVFGMRGGMVYCRPHYDSACMDEFCEDDMNNIYRWVTSFFLLIDGCSGIMSANKWYLNFFVVINITRCSGVKTLIVKETHHHSSTLGRLVPKADRGKGRQLLGLQKICKCRLWGWPAPH